MGAKNDSKKGGGGEGVVLSFFFELELSHFPDFFPVFCGSRKWEGIKKLVSYNFGYLLYAPAWKK